MDGFAVIAGPAAELRVIGESRAGQPAAEARAGRARRSAISTGAAVPEGADAVVPVERTEADGASVRVRRLRARRQHPPRRRGRARRRHRAARRRRAGPGGARRGRRGGPRRRLACARRPRVAVLVTGDELAEPGARARPRAGSTARTRYALARPGRPRRRPSWCCARPCPTAPRPPARALARRARAGGRGVRVRRRVGRPARPREGRARRARRGGALLGRRAAPGQAHLVRHRAAACWRSACPATRCRRWSPSSCSCGPRCAALQGADPAAAARQRGARPRPVARNPRREQAVRVRARRARRRLAAPPRPAPQGSHVLTSMLGADALALIDPRRGRARRPASAWRSSCCEAARPAAAARRGAGARARA